MSKFSTTSVNCNLCDGIGRYTMKSIFNSWFLWKIWLYHHLFGPTSPFNTLFLGTMVGNLNALVSSRRDKFIYNFQKVAPGKFPFYINSATGEIFVISQLNETNQVWSKLGFPKGYEKWKRIFRLCSASYNHYFLRLFWGGFNHRANSYQG